MYLESTLNTLIVNEMIDDKIKYNMLIFLNLKLKNLMVYDFCVRSFDISIFS
jgi:hypothetical protein